MANKNVELISESGFTILQLHFEINNFYFLSLCKTIFCFMTVLTPTL